MSDPQKADLCRRIFMDFLANGRSIADIAKYYQQSTETVEAIIREVFTQLGEALPD